MSRRPQKKKADPPSYPPPPENGSAGTVVAGVTWHNFTIFPGWFCFCPTEEAWAGVMDRLGVIDEPYPGELADARMTTFSRGRNSNGHAHSGKHPVYIITVAGFVDHQTCVPHVVSLLAHEAMHVVQAVLADVGEDPLDACETEAYMLQYVLDFLISDYMESGRWKASGSAGPKAVPEKKDKAS